MDYSIREEDMITPLQSGNTLLQDIAATQVSNGEAAIWWLGQSGYAIKTVSTLFYVDLYLSEHLTAKYAQTSKPHIRITHAPLRGEDLRDVRWVFSSHKHSDHLDPGIVGAMAQNNPKLRWMVPRAIADHAKSLGLSDDKIITTSGDETLTIGNMTVHVVPSSHPGLDYDEVTGYPYVGFIFEVDGVTIYHSGDTVLYNGLAERLQKHSLDIAFLPINGTDERRTELKVPPNMGIDDALTLAGKIGNPLVIPHHYDMFTFNTVDISEFIDAADKVGTPYRVLQCGEKFVYQNRA